MSTFSEFSSFHNDNAPRFPLEFPEFEQFCESTDFTSEHQSEIQASEQIAIAKNDKSSSLAQNGNSRKEARDELLWLTIDGEEDFKTTLNPEAIYSTSGKTGNSNAKDEKLDQNCSSTQGNGFNRGEHCTSNVAASSLYSYSAQMNNLSGTLTTWTTDQCQEASYLNEERPNQLSYKDEREQGISILETGQQVPSMWPGNDRRSSTQTNHDMIKMPQVFSSNGQQPPPFSVEVGDDGQQYMIVDSKYISQNNEGVQLQMGENSTYYLTGINMHSYGDHPISNQRLSDCQSQSTVSSFSSQQETRTRSPFEAFGGFTEEEMIADESVIEEQKRKEVMQMRRREKNKICSRLFRNKQKEKERTLRENNKDMQYRLEGLNKNNEKVFRMLSKAATQLCAKGKIIASAGLQAWNKENRVPGKRNHFHLR